MRRLVIFLFLFSASNSFGQTIRPKNPLQDIQIVVTNVIGNNMVLDSVRKIQENHSYLYAVDRGSVVQLSYSQIEQKKLKDC